MNRTTRGALAPEIVSRLWQQDEMQQAQQEGAGAASGGDGGGQGAGDGAGGGAGDAAGAGAGAGNGSGAGDNSGPAKVTFTPEQQKHIDRIINDATARIKANAEDEARKTVEAERQKAEAKARENQLKEAGEWQKIAEARGEELSAKDTEIQTLRQKAEERDRYAERIHAVINDEVKGWPKSVLKSDPGTDNLDARLVWVESHRDLAKQLLSVPIPETDLGRRGYGDGLSPQQAKEQAEKTLAASGRYSA